MQSNISDQPNRSGISRKKAIRRAIVEALEKRVLLSASWTLTSLASLNDGTTGSSPAGGLVMDPGGNLYGTAEDGGPNGDGTIFEIDAATHVISTIASFNGTNGENPYAQLIIDSSGNLYGTTLNGGANGDGTVFEVAAGSGTITKLADFNGTNGQSPYAPLILDSSGNLYGINDAGGANGWGTAYEIVAGSGTISPIASFTFSEGIGHEGMVMDSSGDLFGEGGYGGANGDGTLFEIAAGTSSVTTLAAFSGTTGQYPQGGPVLDSSGNLYGVTYAGGADGDGTVYELAAGSSTITTLASFNGANGSAPQAGLLVDSDGNLFGTTTGGGANSDGTVFEIAAGTSTITTLLSFNGTNGNQSLASLIGDSSGNLYGVTTAGGANGDGAVFELTPSSTQAVITSQPTVAAAGASQSFSVSLENFAGTVDAGNDANVTLSIASGPSGATLGGTLTASAVNGVASFTGITLSEAGTYTLDASSAGLVSDISAPISVAPAVDVWTGAANDTVWSNGGNWQGGAAPIAGQSVDFPANGRANQDPAIVDVDGSYTVGNVTIEGYYHLYSQSNGTTLTADGNVTCTNSEATPIVISIVLTHNTTFTVGAGDVLAAFGIIDGGNGYGIIKQGDGTLLVGDTGGSYSGPTEVAQGELDLAASPTSGVTVDAGATLDDQYGTVPAITSSGGTVALGGNVSAGNVTLGTGSTLQEQIQGFPPFYELDGELTATGSPVNLTGSTLDVSPLDGFTPSVGHVITLISNQTGSPVTGTFTGLPEGSIAIFDNLAYQVSYAGGVSGQDVTLTVVPIPTATWTGGANDGLWSDAGNWQGDAVPAAGDNVVFPDDGGNVEQISVDQAASVRSLTLHGSYEFNGSSPLDLSSALNEDAGQQGVFSVPIELDASVTLDLNGYAIFFDGITESTPGLGLTKTGSGQANFRYGALAYTGTTDVSDGQFLLAAPSSSAIQVDSGATLTGGGGEAPSVNVADGGTFDSVHDAGDGLTVDSGLTLPSGSTMSFELSKFENGTTLDPTTVTVTSGPIDLNGATLSLQDSGFTHDDSDFLTLIQNNTGSPVSGTFAGLPEGGIVSANGRNYLISYEGGTSGQNVTLTAVPSAAAVWTGSAGDDQWSTPGNWQSDAAPLPTQPVEFPDLGSTPTIDLGGASVTTGDFEMDGNYNFSNGTITLQGNLDGNSGDDQFFTDLVLTHNTTVTIGAADLIYTYDAISDGGQSYTLTKQGDGYLGIFGPGETYTGTTEVAQGTLLAAANLASAVTVDSGASLFGNGSNAGITDNGGTVNLDSETGSAVMTSSGDVSLGSGSTLREFTEYDSTTSAEVDGELIATGSSINLTGSSLEMQPLNNFTPAIGHVITLISNQTGSPVVGTFANLGEGAIEISNGVAYQVSYSGGNSGHDVTLTVVPTAVWTGAGDGTLWADPNNWQGNAVPASGQPVEFPNLGSSQNVDLGGATVSVGDFTMDGDYAFSDGTIALQGNISGNSSLDQFSAGLLLGQNTTITVGTFDEINVDAVISDGGNSYGITKQGGGTLALGGPGNSYTGATEAAQGELRANTTLASAVTVDSGATLDGNGMVAGITDNSGRVSLYSYPDPATLTTSGAVSLGAGSTFEEDVSFDSNTDTQVNGELVATGSSVNLTGSTLDVQPLNFFTPAIGETVTLISNQTGSPVVGTFAGLPEGAEMTIDGVNCQISYAGGQSGRDVTLTTVPGDATQLVVAQQPSSTSTAGQPIGTVIVDVEDANGNLVTSDDSSVTVSSTTSVGGNSSVRAVGGVATFSNLAITRAGTYTLSATDGGLTPTTSDSFSVTPAAAAQLVIAQQPTTIASAAEPIGTVEVGVEDAYGNLVTTNDSDVTISALGGTVSSGQGAVGSILTGTSTVSAHNGTAVFSDLAISQSGTFTLTATDGGLARAATTPVTVVPAPTPPTPSPANVVIAGSRVPALVINPATAFGQSSGVSKRLTFVVTNASGSGKSVFAKTVRVRHGSATLSNLIIRAAGVYNVVVSDSFGHTQTEQLTVVAAAPDKLAFATPVTNLDGRSAISVSVLDRYGNLSAAKDGTVVTLHLGPRPLLGPRPTLSGTLTAIVVDGVANFPDVSVGHDGRASLIATSGNLRHSLSRLLHLG